MDTRLELSKEFKDKVLKFFKSTNKTGWGKIEVQTKLAELWTEFLEEELERKDKFIVPRYDGSSIQEGMKMGIRPEEESSTGE